MKQAGRIYDSICSALHAKEALFFLLIDPDKTCLDTLPDFITAAQAGGVDGFLVGGSLALLPQFEATLVAVKAVSAKPVIIFPGGIHQISAAADAILFLSNISGRNAEQLIGQHVLAAPIIRRIGLEAISTGYMIVESDRVSATEYLSYTKPLPRHKPEIAGAHAMAAELLGMKLLYLESGSGAQQSVPNDMISVVAHCVDIPVIVGGGLRTPQAAAEKVRAGASVVVVGNHFETGGNREQIADFARAIHEAHQNTMLEI